MTTNSAGTSQTLTADELAEIERKYDPETAFRPFGPYLKLFVTAILVSMSVYHFYASGFGLMRELMHRGIHISFVLGLSFLLFGYRRASTPPNPEQARSSSLFSFQGVPLLDYLLCAASVVAAMYLPLLPPEIVAERVGNPGTTDVIVGGALLILVLEAARRSIGFTLPLISIIFILFALFGPFAPGALKHGGTSIAGLVNHLYLTNQGVYGIAIGVMAQYVFLFILFGDIR